MRFWVLVESPLLVVAVVEGLVEVVDLQSSVVALAMTCSVVCVFVR
jgi:hypothetical protein